MCFTYFQLLEHSTNSVRFSVSTVSDQQYGYVIINNETLNGGFKNT